MHKHRLNVRTLHRPADVEWDDESLGNYLVDVVQRAVIRKSAPPVALCIRDDRIDLFDLRQVQPLRLTPPLFLASLSCVAMEGAGPVRGVGMMGLFHAHDRKGAPGVPMAMVFMEWSDCRWWQWRMLVEPGDGKLREDTETTSRAIDGDSRPARLGGWWSLGRRARLRMRMEPNDPPVVH